MPVDTDLWIGICHVGTDKVVVDRDGQPLRLTQAEFEALLVEELDHAAHSQWRPLPTAEKQIARAEAETLRAVRAVVRRLRARTQNVP